MGRKIAITGIGGYFASTLIPLLQQDPEVEEIVGIDVTPWQGDGSKVVFNQEDIRSPRLRDILQGVAALYHLAFIVGEIHDKAKTYDVNVNGSRNVFEACVENNIAKVIYTSSITAYGSHPDNPPVLVEDSPLRNNGDSYYNTEKIEVERLARQCFEDHPEIRFSILRVAFMVGPRMDNMFSDLWTHFPITPVVSGSNSRLQCIHEEDLGAALYVAYQKDIAGIFNVGADDAVSLRWCLKQLGVLAVGLPEKILGPIVSLGFRLKGIPAGRGWVSLSAHSIFCNCAKFQAATGWRPRYNSRDPFLTFAEVKSRKNRAQYTFYKS